MDDKRRKQASYAEYVENDAHVAGKNVVEAELQRFNHVPLSGIRYSGQLFLANAGKLFKRVVLVGRNHSGQTKRVADERHLSR